MTKQLFLETSNHQPDETQLNDCTSDRTQTIQRIRLMSESLGNPTSFMLTGLILLQQSGWLTNTQLQYFQGPVIFGKTEWNTLPESMVEKLVQAVKIERFWQLLEEAESGTPTETCTPAEIVCALQPYTLVAPLARGYAEACLWAFAEMIQQHPTLLKSMSNVFIDDDEPLCKPENYILKELGLTIRRRVIKLTPKQVHPTKPEISQPIPPVVTSIQLSLLEELI
jgi:hypothetical protein